MRQASDIQKVDYKGKKYCFQIVTPERTYHVCAESVDEMNSWINAIKAQQQALKGGPAAKAAGAAGAAPSDHGSAAAGHPAPSGGAATGAAGHTSNAPPGPSSTDAVRHASLPVFVRSLLRAPMEFFTFFLYVDTNFAPLFRFDFLFAEILFRCVVRRSRCWSRQQGWS